MPGAYAHITLVNCAAQQPTALEELGLPAAAIVALYEKRHFVELGAVSPDYPYLAQGQSAWADLMHYEKTATLLREGVKIVRSLQGPAQKNAMAWLLGYAAHMTGDMTIHPVVESLVGPYAENKADHRNCEMHQDAYIFQRLDLGDVGLTQHLESGVGLCGQSGNPDRLDQGVQTVWRKMLAAAYPQHLLAGQPDIDGWHRGFSSILDALRQINAVGLLVPFARHVASGLKLDYPTVANIDHDRYISALTTPEGTMSYSDLFDRAIVNVRSVWVGLSKAILSGDNTFFTTLDDWNLDTGRGLRSNQLVFWKTK